MLTCIWECGCGEGAFLSNQHYSYDWLMNVENNVYFSIWTYSPLYTCKWRQHNTSRAFPSATSLRFLFASVLFWNIVRVCVNVPLHVLSFTLTIRNQCTNGATIWYDFSLHRTMLQLENSTCGRKVFYKWYSRILISLFRMHETFEPE